MLTAELLSLQHYFILINIFESILHNSLEWTQIYYVALELKVPGQSGLQTKKKQNLVVFSRHEYLVKTLSYIGVSCWHWN